MVKVWYRVGWETQDRDRHSMDGGARGNEDIGGIMPPPVKTLVPGLHGSFMQRIEW